jgi:large subunit ribosomal protein L10
MNKEVLKEKTAVVQEVSENVKAANAFVVCEYSKLSVKDVSALRKTLRELDAKAVVYKNTLVSRALSADYKDLNELFTGSNLYFFCKDGTNGSLNAIRKFSKAHEGLKVKGGLLDGKVATADYILEVASLPSKEGLVSMLLSVLQAPMRNLAYSLSEVAKNLPAAAAQSAAPASNATASVEPAK